MGLVMRDSFTVNMRAGRHEDVRRSRPCSRNGRLPIFHHLRELCLPELSCYYRRGSWRSRNHANMQHNLDIHLLPAVGCVADCLLQ